MSRSAMTVICLVTCFMLALGITACTKKVVAPESATFPAGSGAGATGSGMDESTLEQGRSLEEEGLGEDALGAAGLGGPMTPERFVNEDIFFEFDSSALTPEAQEILKAKADWLRRNPDARVLIEGHCDSRGTNEYNIALGERRAEGVKNYMMSLGVGGGRMRTISYGEERPLVPGESEEAWAKNRRAHFEFD